MKGKFVNKIGGKTGTVNPNAFPVDFNNDSHPRFNPKGGTLRQAGGVPKSPKRFK